jgi:hypothetical protein
MSGHGVVLSLIRDMANLSAMSDESFSEKIASRQVSLGLVLGISKTY